MDVYQRGNNSLGLNICINCGLLIELLCGNVIVYEVEMGCLRWPSTVLNADVALAEGGTMPRAFECGGGCKVVRRRRSGIHLTTVRSGKM